MHYELSCYSLPFVLWMQFYFLPSGSYDLHIEVNSLLGTQSLQAGKPPWPGTGKEAPIRRRGFVLRKKRLWFCTFCIKSFFFFLIYFKIKKYYSMVFLPNFFGKIYSCNVIQEITHRSHIHIAHFPLCRKPTSNCTLIEAQCCFCSVEKGAESSCISYARRLIFRYTMKLEEKCCEVYDFWSVSRSYSLKYVFYSANDVFLSHRIFFPVLHILKLCYSPPTVL